MTTCLAHTMKREDLFWLAVIEVSVHDGGGQGEVEELLAWFPGFLLIHLYCVQAHSLWDGATHITAAFSSQCCQQTPQTQLPHVLLGTTEMTNLALSPPMSSPSLWLLFYFPFIAVSGQLDHVFRL